MISPCTSASLASWSMVLLPGSPARQQLLPPYARMLGFDLRPQGVGFLGSPLQIGPNFLAVAEVVGDDGVDIGQHQRIVGADHAFRCHAVLVLLDDDVQADPALADPDHTPFFNPERRKFGMDWKQFVQFTLVHHPILPAFRRGSAKACLW